MSSPDDIISRLDVLIGKLQNVSVPLEQAGALVRDDAVMRIKDQGGDQDWPATWRGGHIGIDTGRMMSSIAVTQQDESTVSVGTNVPYARFFQEGTGIFAGHTPWTVTAQNARALHWRLGGTDYFAKSVTIKGSPQRPFLIIGDDEKAGVSKIFADWFGST